MKTILASLFCFASLHSAQAASSHVTWEGIGFVSKASTVCVQNGIDNVGDNFRVIFAPKEFSQNAVDTVSIVDEKNFLLLRAAADTGLLSGGTNLSYKGRVINNRAFLKDFSATATFTISPAEPDASAARVTITKAVINNAWSVNGCQLTFLNTNLTRRPD